MICDNCGKSYSETGRLKGLCPNCQRLAGPRPKVRAAKKESYIDRLKREGVHRP